MKAKELRQKSKEEINKLLKDNQKRLLELKFNLSGGKVKNIREIRWLKRDIARVSTILKEKNL